MKTLNILISSLLMVAILAACTPGSTVEVSTSDNTIQLSTPGPNPMANQPAENGRIAGALQGLWHGLISPVTLILSFFNPSIQMYEVHNSGNEYNLGFLIGVALVFLLLGLSGGRWR